MVVSPWLQSSIEPDTNIKPLLWNMKYFFNIS
jgi:hypothetical protein